MIKKLTPLFIFIFLLASCQNGNELPGVDTSSSSTDTDLFDQDTQVEEVSSANDIEAPLPHQESEIDLSESVNQENGAVAFEAQLQNGIDARGTVFDGCGSPENYQGETFMEAFSASLTELTLTPQVPYDVTTVSIDTIQEMCVAKEAGLIIAIKKPMYCVKGLVFRYNIKTDELEIAQSNSQEEVCSDSLYAFGKREEKVIPVKAGWFDGGCSSESIYDYNFIENTLTLKESCTKCISDVAGEKDVYDVSCEEF